MFMNHLSTVSSACVRGAEFRLRRAVCVLFVCRTLDPRRVFLCLLVDVRGG